MILVNYNLLYFAYCDKNYLMIEDYGYKESDKSHFNKGLFHIRGYFCFT